MGNRGAIIIETEVHTVSVYTHWEGHRTLEVLRDFLRLGRLPTVEKDGAQYRREVIDVIERALRWLPTQLASVVDVLGGTKTAYIVFHGPGREYRNELDVENPVPILTAHPRGWNVRLEGYSTYPSWVKTKSYVVPPTHDDEAWDDLVRLLLGSARAKKLSGYESLLKSTSDTRLSVESRVSDLHARIVAMLGPDYPYACTRNATGVCIETPVGPRALRAEAIDSFANRFEISMQLRVDEEWVSMHTVHTIPEGIACMLVALAFSQSQSEAK